MPADGIDFLAVYQELNLLISGNSVKVQTTALTIIRSVKEP